SRAVKYLLFIHYMMDEKIIHQAILLNRAYEVMQMHKSKLKIFMCMKGCYFRRKPFAQLRVE
ncbi:MAG: hypothetical protein K2O83_07990, partial [Schaedlerella arabinosiphila]|nr:hypothetical protein [Schaedlerella arabinosiphila]